MSNFHSLKQSILLNFQLRKGKKMKSFISMLSVLCFLLVSCVNQDDPLKDIVEMRNQETIPPQVLSGNNMDYLIELAERVKEARGKDYTEELLLEMQIDTNNKDYHFVVKNYVESDLKTEILSYWTINKSNYPKQVIVLAKDKSVYLLNLFKWHNYSGIWTVNYHSWVDTYGKIDDQYELVELDTTPNDVKKWVADSLKNSDWDNDYLILGEATYILIKSSSNPADSVDVLEVWASSGSVTIHYEKLEEGYNADLFGVNDYVLIKVNYPTEEITVITYIKNDEYLDKTPY